MNGNREMPQHLPSSAQENLFKRCLSTTLFAQFRDYKQLTKLGNRIIPALSSLSPVYSRAPDGPAAGSSHSPSTRTPQPFSLVFCIFGTVSQRKERKYLESHGHDNMSGSHTQQHHGDSPSTGTTKCAGAPELTSCCPSLRQFLSSFKTTEERKQETFSWVQPQARGMSAHKLMWQAVLGA